MAPRLKVCSSLLQSSAYPHDYYPCDFPIISQSKGIGFCEYHRPIQRDLIKDLLSNAELGYLMKKAHGWSLDENGIPIPPKESA